MRTTPSYPGSTTYTNYSTAGASGSGSVHGSSPNAPYQLPNHNRYDPYAQRRAGGPATPTTSTSAPATSEYNARLQPHSSRNIEL